MIASESPVFTENLKRSVQNLGFAVETFTNLSNASMSENESEWMATLIDADLVDDEGASLSPFTNDPKRVTAVLYSPLKKHRWLIGAREKLGIDDLLSKPFRQLELSGLLEAARKGKSEVAKIRSGKLDPDAAADDSVLASVKVLAAEDNMANQAVVRAMSEKIGFHLDVVNNGLEAVTALTQGQYDLVLMDCQMPVMDGFTATRKLRSRDNGGDIPIIAMTANALAGDREKCLDAGMSDYLSKPVKLEELRQMISKWIVAKLDAELGLAESPPLAAASTAEAVEPPPQVAESLPLPSQDSFPEEDRAPAADKPSNVIDFETLHTLKMLQSPKRPNFLHRPHLRLFENRHRRSGRNW